jgi:hypothetical protein
MTFESVLFIEDKERADTPVLHSKQINRFRADFVDIVFRVKSEYPKCRYLPITFTQVPYPPLKRKLNIQKFDPSVPKYLSSAKKEVAFDAALQKNFVKSKISTNLLIL